MTAQRGQQTAGRSAEHQEVCENKKLPVGCIVMLSQAKTNQAWRLRPAEAFTSLYGQITMNRWDREGLVHSLDLLEQLAGKVPVYHLACDISEDAVKTLEQEIGSRFVRK